jgi:hypothetical protein
MVVEEKGNLLGIKRIKQMGKVETIGFFHAKFLKDG